MKLRLTCLLLLFSLVAGVEAQMSVAPIQKFELKKSGPELERRAQAGSVGGRAKAKETYDRLIQSARELYEKNVAHYAALLKETAQVETPDGSLNEAFVWAKIGIDKGVATNPFLGTGLLAGFRTSGESERPGFAWTRRG
jgi:hypothetical protein